ncbi:hypothetical protein D922_01577 [Enterococcus faecalis 06-MB-DW-09]|nr:hypothetical protein D922_01577 [Enterococcus faecalis 06-MB-DW-09]
MLAETIQTPEEYLAYSRKELIGKGFFNKYKKIEMYYEGLCLEFKEIYDSDESFFKKWGQLLSVDAQIQILLEWNKALSEGEAFEFEEEKIINMIRQDKKYFYREITGGSMNEIPRWGLIYLSEE